jgi:acetyl esterase/lipase
VRQRLTATVAATFLTASLALAADRFSKRIVYSVPGMDQVRVERDLTYRGTGDGGVKMDVYVPHGLSASDRRPVVFFVHGGPLGPDMRPKDWGVYRSYGELVAASGFVGVTFNHRLFSVADLDRSAEEVAAAVAFVRGNAARFSADPERTSFWAVSGGGPLLAFAFRDRPAHVRAVVSYYAILDLRGTSDAAGNPMTDDMARRLSPAYAVESGTGPFPAVLIGRAGQDDPVINASVETFVRAAWAKGVSIDVLNHPAGQHGFDSGTDDDRSREVIRRTLDFLKEQLKP